MAILVSLTSFAAALGDGYEKVTNISNLTTGDRVVVYADAISKGVTGWNGSKDATVAESGWVEYLVEVASGGVYLKDETAKNYIASPGSSNQFKYGTKAVCSVDANGVLKCNNRLLCQNGTYYRMYTSVGSYKPFYVYKVIADAGGDETEDLGDALKWSATSATVQMGADDNEYPTLTNDKNVDVTYSSSSTNVATIDANGVVTLVKEGTTTISALYEGGEIDGVTYSAKNVSYTLTVKPAPLVIEPIEGGIIDVLTHKTLAATSSSYANFTSKQAANENHSDAVYAGRSARNGNATQYSIQLNTIDKGRIATTTSGGIAKRVYVKWSTQPTLNTNARALNIYGSNDAFTGSETANPSTKIGTITFTTGAAEAYVDFEGDYKYILITGSGAIYMDEIQVTWVVAEGTVTTPTISGADEFIESTEVTISAEDGLKVYYTLDGTDPTNASTEYTAPFELTATTTVKAVAYDGEKASDIISKTFKQLQVLTCEEAAELCAATESADKYVIRGYVTNIATAWSDQYSNISFWMADTKDGGKVFEAFRVQPIIAAENSVKVGDYVEVIGKIVLYNTTPETSAGGTYTIIPAPVVNHTITVSANPAEAGTVTGGGEFEETDEITVKAVANEDYEFTCWTEGTDTVATTAEYTFEVLANRNLVANFVAIPAPEVKSGKFSVGENKLATFAPGNLQFNTGDSTWRFAREQYNVVGAENINLGDPAFKGWIDMFGWSTAETYFGVNPSNSNELYDGEFVEWGKVFEGENWSTLSADEWKYLLNTRANATQLKQIATIDTVLGIMLFPDAWVMPAGAEVAAKLDTNYNVNVYNYTVAQWDALEDAGAIFLPAAGRRTGGYGNMINYDQQVETREDYLVNGGFYRWQDNTNIYCYYWTSTINENKNVSYLNNIVALGDDEYTIGTGAIWGEKGRYGQSVRLAQVETVEIVEPVKTIEWVLNGGDFPAVVVPTNAELWEAFKPYYNKYYTANGKLVKDRADQPIDKVSTFAAAYMQEIMTDEKSEYKWLGDYVLGVAAGQGVTLPTDMASANEGAWRWAVHAFFNATAGANGAAGTDFTEAGKPEVWGAAYQAAYGVVLPTEAVEADYTLPTPVKTGFTFVGWYDNAEGEGDAMTVLKAGWSGTIYAIWKQDSTTGVENTVVAEQVVKIVRNGQVLIMVGDKTFNMMGPEVK